MGSLWAISSALATGWLIKIEQKKDPKQTLFLPFPNISPNCNAYLFSPFYFLKTTKLQAHPKGKLQAVGFGDVFFVVWVDDDIGT